MSENFVIVPESSYLYDPCTKNYWNKSNSGWLNEYEFVDSFDSVIQVINKTGEHLGGVKVDPMFSTHMLGAYEDNEKDLLHVDVLKWKDASAYTVYTFVDNAIDGKDYPEKLTRVTRYSINMKDWTLKEEKNLINDERLKNSNFEFPNINPAYQGKPYSYAYLVKNVFKTKGSVIKLNVVDGSVIEKKMPTGMFPTEPFFISSPNATKEDDGIVLVSGIDGHKKKGFIRIFNASTMEVITHGTAPKLSLFGLHSRFYPFDIGCEKGDCTPEDTPTTTEQPTTPSSASIVGLELWLILLNTCLLTFYLQQMLNLY